MAVLSFRISGGAFANQGAPLRHQTMGFPVGKRNGDPGPGTLLEAGSEVRKVGAATPTRTVANSSGLRCALERPAIERQRLDPQCLALRCPAPR